ncbi:MAG: hypothetical protein IH969_02540 [Candidatus Krumholzibacteriota bacterium]|nr:hypothetical protein [Candidatus Krumholzibacteriota bacterium]
MRLLESLGMEVAFPSRTIYLKPAEEQAAAAAEARARDNDPYVAAIRRAMIPCADTLSNRGQAVAL